MQCTGQVINKAYVFTSSRRRIPCNKLRGLPICGIPVDVSGTRRGSLRQLNVSVRVVNGAADMRRKLRRYARNVKVVP